MWANPQETADLVTLTEEILNEKLHFFGVVFKIFERKSLVLSREFKNYF